MLIYGCFKCTQYGASFVPKFLWESIFRGDPIGPPLCTNGSQKYLTHLSVEVILESTKPSPNTVHINTIAYNILCNHNFKGNLIYQFLQRLSPKHTARGVTQSPYLTYSHGKAYLSKQLQWHAAGDPHLGGGRSRVRAPSPGPCGCAVRAFSSTLPSFLLPELRFFTPSPLPRERLFFAPFLPPL